MSNARNESETDQFLGVELFVEIELQPTAELAKGRFYADAGADAQEHVQVAAVLLSLLVEHLDLDGELFFLAISGLELFHFSDFDDLQLVLIFGWEFVYFFFYDHGWIVLSGWYGDRIVLVTFLDYQSARGLSRGKFGAGRFLDSLYQYRAGMSRGRANILLDKP